MHEFLHWLIHDVTPMVTGLVRAHHAWCFPIAFLVAFCESFVGLSLLVPGTVMLIAMGAVIGASHIGLFPAFAGAVLGSVLGDWISYAIGFHYRSRILSVWPFTRFAVPIERGFAFFRAWGVWAIFFGRFLGPLRATVPLVSGMSHLGFWSFQIANAGSALVWAFALLAPGAEALRRLMP